MNRTIADPFEQPKTVASLMAGFARPWYVAGGWAIDLYLNRWTRDHEDIEIAIFRRDQHALPSFLEGWEFKKVIPGGGGTVQPWDEGEWLELPIHEVHAFRDQGEPATLEILLNEMEDDVWRYRRNLEVTLDLRKVGVTSELGIPILSPEIVLLYKAKHQRSQDEEDFQNAIEVMPTEARLWLRWAIEICHLEHPWLGKL